MEIRPTIISLIAQYTYWINIGFRNIKDPYFGALDFEGIVSVANFHHIEKTVMVNSLDFEIRHSNTWYTVFSFTFDIFVHIWLCFWNFTVNVLCNFSCKQRFYVLFRKRGEGVSDNTVFYCAHEFQLHRSSSKTYQRNSVSWCKVKLEKKTYCQYKRFFSAYSDS